MARTKLVYPKISNLRAMLGRISDGDPNPCINFTTEELLTISKEVDRQIKEERVMITLALLNCAVTGQKQVAVFERFYCFASQEGSVLNNWIATSLAIHLKQDLETENYPVTLSMTHKGVRLEVDL